jgi:AraC-like DNA-binding protein
MLDGLSFGWRTAILALAIAQLLLFAIALRRPLENRLANQTLALLLVVLCGVLTPWMIGFAGFYDRWRELSFAPFSITLAVAPLFYFYIYAMTEGARPPRAALHLAPAIAQATYLAGAFVLLRQPFKNEWMVASAPAYNIIVGGGGVIGLVLYARASLRHIDRYRAALARQRSDDHRFALVWLERAVRALLALTVVWAAYRLWDFVSPLSYRGLMGLYLAIAAFALFIAIEGWRHATAPFPRLSALETAAAEPLTQQSERDWSVLGAEWSQKVRDAGWHKDPEISVATLARHLGVNTAYLSRAINEGLGVNFSTFINALRSEEIAATIKAGRRDDLLDLALEAGFGSKASFNRAFRARFGVTPSEYRRKHGSNRK